MASVASGVATGTAGDTGCQASPSLRRTEPNSTAASFPASSSAQEGNLNFLTKKIWAQKKDWKEIDQNANCAWVWVERW